MWDAELYELLMFVTLILARRFKAKNKKSVLANVSIRSSSIGIALGCAIIVILLSVMNGFEKALTEEYLSVTPHVEFQAAQGMLKDWHQIVQQIKEQVGLNAAPVIKIQAMLQKKQKFYGAEVRAIDLTLESQVSNLKDYITETDWQAFKAQPNSVILGQGLAKRMGVQRGDKVTLLIPQPVSKPNTGQVNPLSPKRIQVTYLGDLAFGGDLDFYQVFMHLSFAQEVLQAPEQANAVRVRVENVFDAPELAATLGFSLQEYVYIHDWTRTQGHLYRDIQLIRTLMYLVLFLLMAVASFNIVSGLMMQVEEKKPAIAILKTMGASQGFIIRIFMWQGALSGVPGGLIGVMLGYLMAGYLPNVFAWLEHLSGQQMLPSDIYFIDSIPMQLMWQDGLFVFTTALTMSLLATLYPAFCAARLAPADALRHA